MRPTSTGASMLVTDATAGVGALVADAAAQLGHEVAGLADLPRGSVHQQAEEWLAVMRETAPTVLLVCGPQLGGGGGTRRSVDAASAALAAASRCDTLERLVLLSGGEVYGASGAAPTFVAEEFPTSAAGGPAAAALIELERRAAAFASTRPDVATTILRPAETLGARPYGLLAEHFAASGSRVTADVGYDPQVQFLTDHDLAVATLHALRNDCPGVFNIAPVDSCTVSDAIRTAGRGRMPFSRTMSMVGAIVGTSERWPPELHRLLRYGRALDARRSRAAGFPAPAGSLDAVRGWARVTAIPG